MPKRETGEVILRGKVWHIRFYDRRGRRVQESSGSAKRGDAERLLRSRLKAKDDGLPTGPKIGKIRFPEAARNLITDFATRGLRSIAVTRRRIEKHLAPFFGTMLMADISTPDVREYIKARQAAQTVTRSAYDRKRANGTTIRIKGRTTAITAVSNAEINRELATLKRMFSLAIEDGKLLHKPHIPMLEEHNVRTGFFERDQFRSVRSHLPDDIQPVVTFAYITGWCIASEVLPLQWRQVDFGAGEVRLDAGTTKNGEGRVFVMTQDLRTLLTTLRAEHDTRQKAGQLCPYVFVRMVAKGRGGPKVPQPIKAFTKAWKAACRAAGCPGRIPHDLRRTAVRNMVRSGIPERVAMRLTGHKTASVFARYNIVSDGDLHDAAARLNGTMGTLGGPRQHSAS